MTLPRCSSSPKPSRIISLSGATEIVADSLCSDPFDPGGLSKADGEDAGFRLTSSGCSRTSMNVRFSLQTTPSIKAFEDST
eukprot:CAMPEP_0197679142 /NCGR_PEP_ID=MMETSP1338-20131121/91180_1 /TAXON_ID=43686 ORGANISM="Pelagodinium beii, Strain RCC1491" /NCGR_SAMPLE_ID=MMETSP1338 /ASSEMBLY_ACC=CAM_ASM_000754 /LENGTH=80 /DNA_ID=CAMNT_0043260165 /DNA_START=53 /DNA_END=292 /DNA_ORIENTATION=-